MNIAVEDKERVASALSEDPLLTPLAWGYKNTAKQQTSVSAVSGFVGSLVGFEYKQGWLGRQLIVCLSNSTGQGGVSYFPAVS